VRTASGQWLAYGVTRYGVNVACGDIDGDGTDEVITGAGPGPGFGPHVRCFQPEGQVVHNAGFMAYGTLRWGVNVACGDIDGDGTDEIVTGAGPGDVFGAHVRGWNWDGGPDTTAISGVNFLAYGTHRWGVNVACGDIDGDGIDEIVTGAGPGDVFGPHVRGWNWDGSGSVTPFGEVSYFAYETLSYGVNVACGDLDHDGIDEIITGPGPNPAFGSRVKAWDWDGSGAVEAMPGIDFFAYPWSTMKYHGVVVAAGDVNGNGHDELVTAPGPGPEADAYIRYWKVVDGEPDYLGSVSRAYDFWIHYGGNVAVGKFD
jgi:hypothetical protein